MTMPPAAKTDGADAACGHLIKHWPLPARRLFGDLSDEEQAPLLGLNIATDKNRGPEPPDDVSDAPP